MSKYEPRCVDPMMGDLLVEHASERLGAPERARFEAHLETCLACSEQLAPMRRLLAAIGSPSDDEGDLASLSPSAPRSLLGGAPALLAIAAVVAALLLGLAWQRARDVVVVREIRDLEARLTHLEEQNDEILRALGRSPEGVSKAKPVSEREPAIDLAPERPIAPDVLTPPNH
jgi:hypothetical protein